jgi:metal-responsive CopG/Arc/MetJ family transcriptional regulator
MAKVLVSIDDDLLRRVDRRAAELGLSRSAYVEQLARTHLDARRRSTSQRAKRALERGRAACAGAAVAGDSTELIRRMRDER